MTTITLDKLVEVLGAEGAASYLHGLQVKPGGLLVDFCVQKDNSEENTWITPWNPIIGFNDTLTAVDIEGSATACAGQSNIYARFDREDWHMIRLVYEPKKKV